MEKLQGRPQPGSEGKGTCKAPFHGLYFIRSGQHLTERDMFLRVGGRSYTVLISIVPLFRDSVTFHRNSISAKQLQVQGNSSDGVVYEFRAECRQAVSMSPAQLSIQKTPAGCTRVQNIQLPTGVPTGTGFRPPLTSFHLTTPGSAWPFPGGGQPDQGKGPRFRLTQDLKTASWMIFFPASC